MEDGDKMTIKDFLESGIDLSYNRAIALTYEKFPHRHIIVEIPEYLNGFPEDIKIMCEESFAAYLNYSLETITIEDFDGLTLCLSIF